MGAEQDTPNTPTDSGNTPSPDGKGGASEQTHTLTESQIRAWADIHASDVSSKRVGPVMSENSKLKLENANGQLAGLLLLDEQNRNSALQQEMDDLRAKGENTPPQVHELNQQRADIRRDAAQLRNDRLALNIEKQDLADVITKGKEAGVLVHETEVAAEYGLDRETLHQLGPFTSLEDMKGKASIAKQLRGGGASTPAAAAPAGNSAEAAVQSFRPDSGAGGGAERTQTTSEKLRTVIDAAKGKAGVLPNKT